MRLESFTLEHSGSMYTYNPCKGVWILEGQLVYSKNVPVELKQMREKLIDCVST